MAAFGILLFALLTVALAIGSGRIWWIWGARLFHGRPALERRFRRDEADVPIGAVALVLAWLGVNLLLMLPAGGDAGPVDFDADRIMRAGQASIAEGLFLSPVALGLVLVPVRCRTDRARLGFHTDRPGTQIRDGIVGLLAAFLPVYLVMLASLPLRSEETLHPLLRLLSEEGLGPQTAWIVVLAVVIAPLKEELLFRVILQSWLERVLNRRAALLATAVLFSAVHGFPDALGIFPLALVLGYVFQQRRSFLAVFTLHAAFNAYNLAAVAIQPFLNEYLERIS